MNLTPTSELEAINLMLQGIGETPVNTVEDSGVVDAVLARQTLHNVSRDLQEKGWHWNTLEGLVLAVALPDNEIFLPDNTLKVDSSGKDEHVNVIQRGKRLFNKDTNSYSFTGPLTVDLVEFLPFEELPQAARSFIALNASRKFQQDRVGSETLSTFHQKDELKAWAALLASEAETADRTIFDNYSVARVLAR